MTQPQLVPKLIVLLSLGWLVFCGAVACQSEDSEQDTPVKANPSYSDLLRAFQTASFQITFRYESSSGREGVLLWTKHTELERLDRVVDRTAISGTTDISDGFGDITCNWASDPNREHFDATCFPGSNSLRGEFGALLHDLLIAEFKEAEVVAGLKASCFDVSLPGYPIGTVCLTDEGLPVSAVIRRPNVLLEYEATKVETVPLVTVASHEPVIPDASREQPTTVRQVTVGNLALPALALLRND